MTPASGGSGDNVPTDGALPLRGIEQADTGGKGPPPVHLWNPPDCGDIDMRIRRDGTWEYQGSPIRRPELVRLFASILRLDDDGRYYLVTPVEKMGIRVDDAPFVAVRVDRQGRAGPQQSLRFTTNVGDESVAGPDAPIRISTDPVTGEPSPYVLVRRNLEALIARPVYYELVSLGVDRTDGDRHVFGVWSGGVFFPLGRLGPAAGP